MNANRAVNLSETLQPNLYAAIIISFSLAIIVVALRFWCRWSNGVGFWADDWLILVALSSSLGLTVDQLWWIPRGLGRHIQTFGPNVVEIFSIGLFTAELTYTGVIVFVKLAILALYWRIFHQNSSIRLPVGILTTLVLMWGIAVFFLTLLQCIPPRGFWDKTIEASCNVDSQRFLFAISIPNILIDVTLLSLPVPYVIRLNIAKSQKRAILSMFTLGGFVCIASILRLVAVVTQPNNEDLTWNIVNQSIWATVEANLAIISACLPTLRPIWIIVRGNKSSKAESNVPQIRPAVRNPQNNRSPYSRALSLLKSRPDGQEGSQILTSRTYVTSGTSSKGLIDEQQQTELGIAIPLSHLEAKQSNDMDNNTTGNLWTIEHEE
ncbi:integral membrane protein [Xylaria cf. heliscus]|nr:integral membrane protein [Xylaria cf. heliscus]